MHRSSPDVSNNIYLLFFFLMPAHRCQELHVVPFCNFCWVFPVLSVMFWLDDKNGSRCPEVQRVHLYVTSHLGQEGSNAELQKVTNLNMNAHVWTDQPSVFTLNIYTDKRRSFYVTEGSQTSLLHSDVLFWCILKLKSINIGKVLVDSSLDFCISCATNKIYSPDDTEINGKLMNYMLMCNR